MGDILNEAYRIVQCKECPWYRSCVMPMRFSVDDLRRQLEGTGQGTATPPADINMQNFLSNMAVAAQNSLAEGCPVFIERLRANPELAQRIKKLMQEWGQEEKPGG